MRLASSDSHYVESILDRILLYGRYDFWVRPVLLIADTDERLAVSTPDHEVYLSRGLVGALKTEEEFAFIVAHELCHFQEGHFLEHADRRIDVELAADTCAVRAMAKANYPIQGISRVIESVYLHESHLEEAAQRIDNLTAQRATLRQKTWSPANPLVFQQFKERVSQQAP